MAAATPPFLPDDEEAVAGGIVAGVGRALNAAAPWLFTAALLVAWQLAVVLGNVPEMVLPTPWQIAKRVVTDFPLLLSDAGVTLIEIVSGFGLAVALGIPLALGVFYSRIFERTLYPVLIALQSIPKVALAPLLVMWFGYGLEPKVVISFLTAFFPIVISTVAGLVSLEQEMVHLVRSMGASERQTFMKIRLPAALPSIFAGLKIGVGLAVIGAIIGEYVSSDAGLGYRQLTANSHFDSSLNFAALFAIAMVGVITFGAMQLLERLMIRVR